MSTPDAPADLAFTACPRAIAVTDFDSHRGLAPGAMRKFRRRAGPARAKGVGLRADGTIAGAGITLDEGVRRLIAAGVAPEVALAAATTRRPRRSALPDRGRTRTGRAGRSGLVGR